MALQDQIKSAQAEGYSSQEIVNFLSQSNPQVKEAVSEGYQPDEIISFVTQSGAQTAALSNPVMSAIQKLLPSRATLEAPITASKALGTAVEAGGAGIGDIDSALIPVAINTLTGTSIPHPSIANAVMQGGQDVNAVEAGQPPTSIAGTVGKTVGSFFTPNQIALQAAGGAAAPYVAKGLGNIASPIISGLVSSFPKASSWAGLEPEAVSALASSPQAVSNAAPLTNVAENVAGTVQGLSKQGMDIASAGKAALSDETPVLGLKDKLMNYAANLQKGPAADEADEAAAKFVSSFAKKMKLNLSEADIGDMISDLDDKINMKYNQANPTIMTEAKVGIRRTLSQALQDQNPEYAKAMADSAATFEPTEALSKSLGVEGGIPSDRTINALRNKATPEALATQRALGSIPGLSDTINNAVSKDALKNSLLGKIALYLAPKLRGAVQGGVQTLPTVGNAAAQTVAGLQQ